MLAMVLPSHAGDGATEVTWLWCDVDVESCDGVATQGCIAYGKVAQSPSSEH
jgi:hypothetical protein